MMPVYEKQDYYKTMLKLQEKLRESEQERIRLEERYKQLVQESRNRHEACINRLRLRYLEFLEEQRARDERNHKLRGALDKIDNSLALLTAKTERLNILKKQCESNVQQLYGNQHGSNSNIGDSGIESQKFPLMNARNKPDPLYSTNLDNWSRQIQKENLPNFLSTTSKFRNFRTTSPIRDEVRLSRITFNASQTSLPTSSYQTSQLQFSQPRLYESTMICSSQHCRDRAHSTPKFETSKSSLSRFEMSVKDKINLTLPGSTNCPIRTIQRTIEQPKAYEVCNSMSSDFQKILKNRQHLSPRVKSLSCTITPRLPYTSRLLISDYNFASVSARRPIVERENELEQYVRKIRELHEGPMAEPRSLDDLDQNTSGDLLNETLSDYSPDLPVDCTKDKDDVSKKGNKCVTKKCKEEKMFSGSAVNSDPANAVNEFTRRMYVPVSKTRHYASSINQYGSSAAPAIYKNNTLIVTSDIETTKTWQSVENFTKLPEEEGKYNSEKDSKVENIILKEKYEEIKNDCNEQLDELDPWNSENLLKEVKNMSLNENSSTLDVKAVEYLATNQEDQLKRASDAIENNEENTQIMQNKEQNNNKNVSEYQPDKQYVEGSHHENVEQSLEQEQYGNETSTRDYDVRARYSHCEKKVEDLTEQSDNQQYDPDGHYKRNVNVDYNSSEQAQNRQYDVDEQYDQNLDSQSMNEQQKQEHKSNDVYNQESNLYSHIHNICDQYEGKVVQCSEDPNVQCEEQNPNQQYTNEPNLQYSEQDSNQQYETEEQLDYDPILQYNEQYQVEEYSQNINDQLYPNQEDKSYLNQQFDGDKEGGKGDENQDILQYENKRQEGRQSETSKESESEIIEKNTVKADERVNETKENKDVIKAIFDSDTESTIERNISNAESDFDFN